MKSNTRSLLLLLHMPPPVHGVTVLNQQIASIEELGEIFNEVRLLPVSYGAQIDHLGAISFAKLTSLIRLMGKICATLPFWRRQVVLFSPSLRGGAFFRDFLLALLLRMGGAIVVYHIHGRDIAELHGSMVYRSLYGFLFGKGYVICLANALTEDLLPYVHRERLFTVLNGIQDPFSDEQINKAIELRKERAVPRILFLSTMMRAKGPFVLLEALAQLKNRGVVFEACFAGPFFTDFNENDFSHCIHTLKLEGCVSYLGAVYGKEKIKSFLNADIFVFPTLREAFGLVALEAMAAALPVIASDEGALPEIVNHGETGFLFPAGDSTILAEHLEKLCESNTLRMSLGRCGRERFLSRFTHEVFKMHMAEALTKVCHHVDKSGL